MDKLQRYEATDICQFIEDIVIKGIKQTENIMSFEDRPMDYEEELEINCRKLVKEKAALEARCVAAEEQGNRHWEAIQRCNQIIANKDRKNAKLRGLLEKYATWWDGIAGIDFSAYCELGIDIRDEIKEALND